jgi:hypothetical protein
MSFRSCRFLSISGNVRTSFPFSTSDLQIVGQPCGEFRKAVEGVSISRDELAVAVLQMCQGPETGDLQFVEKLVGDWSRIFISKGR